MANVADILLQVQLVESNDSIKMEQIKSELLKLSYEYFEILYEDNNTLEISMGSAWSAPISNLQQICDTYNCRILGVGSDFSNLYVDSFELYNDLY